LDAISKFGRSFSVLRIPYALKLLIQELQVMNIQMRIITEDNIDQLTNLCYQSRNIDKLLHIEPGDLAERSIKEIIENYKLEMETKIRIVDNEKNEKNNKEKEVLSVEPQNFESEDQEFIPESPPTAPGSPAFNPRTPSFSPPSGLETETPPPEPGTPYNPFSGGSINLFSDPNMNASFNMLNGESQSKILQMEPNEREIVMREIIKKSGRQENTMEEQTFSTNNSNQNDNVLEPYFNALPVGKQLEVLKGGYQSMSKEFSKLEGKMEDPLITIKKPISIQEEVTKKLPLLSVEDKLDTSTSSDSTDSSTNDTSTNDTTNSSTSNTKKIIF
jgi:hypothetical protein